MYTRISRGFIKITSVLLIILLLISGCNFSRRKPDINEYTEEIFALNTILTFKVYGDGIAKEALAKAIERIHEIEARMSTTIDDSDVSLINKNAGGAPTAVNQDTFYVIERALEYGQMTDGAFDITIYPVAQLWGITSDNPRVPTQREIQEKLQLVDYRKVILDKEAGTVYLPEQGMGIDLGAIAKGYAADEVAKILVEAGVESALINMGGNVMTVGKKPNGDLWRIGVQDPRMEETGYREAAIVQADNETIVSSGDYERYIVEVYQETGKRYHHIFDPNTGYPADTGLMATTIIAANSIDADALSTSLFIMGIDKGFELIEKINNVKALAITTDKEIYTTSGLEDKIEFPNKEYIIKS